MTTQPQQQPQGEELETTAIARVEERPLQKIESGTSALAEMTDAEFAHKLEGMKKGRARVKEVQRALMTEGVHYGFLPGQKGKDGAKAGLLKAGAEVLCELYHLVPEVEITKSYGDPANLTSPAISVAARSLVHLGAIDGPVVSVGVGAANSWETKYRYRQAQRECPSCGAAAIMKSKYPETGPKSFYCNPKANGCGMSFAPDDQRITMQEAGRIANPDAYDLENTLVKMAEKRAKVDGTISATGASDLFTQDVEDLKADHADADATEALGYEKTPNAEHPNAPKPARSAGNGAKPPTERPTAAGPGAAGPGKPGKPASDAQIGMILGLLGSKFGVTGKLEKEAALAEKLGYPKALAELTVPEASDLIRKLQQMTDVATPTRAAAAPGVAAKTLDDEKTRTIYRENLKAAAEELARTCDVDSPVVEQDGVVCLVGPLELEALGFPPTAEIPLGDLDVPSLMKAANCIRMRMRNAQAVRS